MSDNDEQQSERDAMQGERDSRQGERDEWQGERDDRQRERTGHDSQAMVIDSDGMTRPFVRRKTAAYMKNGHRANDYLEFNIHAWKVAAGFVGALVVICGAVYGTLDWVLYPRFKAAIIEQIRAQDGPIERRLALAEADMDAHLLDIARASGDYVKKIELRDDLQDIKDQLADIRREMHR